ncbi:MAG: hypothetical protein CMJ52_04325 [Planctomycetaceae bacterium]|nr:hypothetical protein [Planctomycetaceae bacterium]
MEGRCERDTARLLDTDPGRRIGSPAEVDGPSSDVEPFRVRGAVPPPVAGSDPPLMPGGSV